MWTCPISQYTSLAEAGIAIRELFAFVLFLIRSVWGRKRKRKLKANFLIMQEMMNPLFLIHSDCGGFLLQPVPDFFPPLFFKVNDNRIFRIAFVSDVAFISEMEVFHQFWLWVLAYNVQRRGGCFFQLFQCTIKHNPALCMPQSYFPCQHKQQIQVCQKGHCRPMCKQQAWTPG